MKFNYFYQEQPTEDLEIEDAGNVALIANDESGMEYYLILKTDLGLTRSIYYGPSIPDIPDNLPANVSYTFSEFEYNEGKIYKMINKFLNGNGVTQARIVEKEDIIPNIRRFIDYV